MSFLPHPARVAAHARHHGARGLWRAYLHRRLMRRKPGPKMLRPFADAYPEAYFIEIGANDGDQWDFLRPFVVARSWAGIMVEPVPYVFERLCRNYAGLDGVVFENAAIADRDGRLPFYHLSQVEDGVGDQVPRWYDAIGSFSRETVLRHAREIPDLEQRLVRTDVPCLSFESLCRKHAVDGVDLLLIDAEGYDYEIVRRIDFGVYRPRVLVYEHQHLSPGDRAECRATLQQLGYELVQDWLDTWCLDMQPDDRLTRRWRRLGIPGPDDSPWDDSPPSVRPGAVR